MVAQLGNSFEVTSSDAIMQGKGLVDIGSPELALHPPGVDPLSPSDYYSMELDRVNG